MKIITFPHQLFTVLILSMIVSNTLANIANANDSSSTGSRSSWYFQAYLDDSLIGYHSFSVDHSGDETTVQSKADFDVQFLFITVYSYRHKNIEVWKSDCLKSLYSTTDDNGDDVFVKIDKDKSGMRIETTASDLVTDSCIRSFAYWDLELIQSDQLLNSQTGELIDINFSYVGKDTLNINKQKIEAKKYQLKGEDSKGVEIEIDLWYSQKNAWLALQSKLENGSYLRYELSEVNSK